MKRAWANPTEIDASAIASSMRTIGVKLFSNGIYV